MTGLVKSGMASSQEIQALVDRVVTETAGSEPKWIDYLWDELAAIRAEAEGRRSRAKRRHRYHNWPGGRSVS